MNEEQKEQPKEIELQLKKDKDKDLLVFPIKEIQRLNLKEDEILFVQLDPLVCSGEDAQGLAQAIARVFPKSQVLITFMPLKFQVLNKDQVSEEDQKNNIVNKKDHGIIS